MYRHLSQAPQPLHGFRTAVTVAAVTALTVTVPLGAGQHAAPDGAAHHDASVTADRPGDTATTGHRRGPLAEPRTHAVPSATARTAVAAHLASNADRPASGARLRCARVLRGCRAAVVCETAEAARVGGEILRAGGTAVDAAVAVALALCVTYPPAGNIGGGGFMMVLPPNGRQPVCIDYRETAPRRATREMLAEHRGRLGRLLVGVPGTLRGLQAAHARFGRLPWKRLVAPAVRLARCGFVVDRFLAESLNGVLSDADTRAFPEFLRVFAPPNGQRWRPGDRLVQPDLARTLQAIADCGPDVFYCGTIARALVEDMRRNGGLIRWSDLRGYRAIIRDPVFVRLDEYVLCAPPPPSSGGICLAEMLHMLRRFPIRRRGRFHPDTLHWMVEVMRRAYADRARFLGDPAFAPYPLELLTERYAYRRAADIDLEHATPSENVAPEIPLAPESPDTTHFSVVDAEGMVVSNTYTLEAAYGSRVVVPGLGFLLNNEMGDFNPRPGHTDRRGVIGTPANTIAPGKRMLSSQTPTIVLRRGRPWLVTGSPGGRTIINTVLQVVLNVAVFEMDLPAALQAPRIHHQWFPDEIVVEAGAAERLRAALEELRRRGHRIRISRRSQGSAHSLLWDNATESWTAAADSRRSGAACGL
ncbi:MAG: gamma-glutamyltransferase [Planctomycetota bacterium]|nr:MAG: gamma-glutamyltransferase [Planctomycetota bacterium]